MSLEIRRVTVVVGNAEALGVKPGPRWSARALPGRRVRVMTAMNFIAGLSFRCVCVIQLQVDDLGQDDRRDEGEDQQGDAHLRVVTELVSAGFHDQHVGR